MLGFFSFRRSIIGGASAPLYCNDEKFRGCVGAVILFVVFLALCVLVATYSLLDIETSCLSEYVAGLDLALNIGVIVLALPMSIWLYKCALRRWWSDEEVAVFLGTIVASTLLSFVLSGLQLFALVDGVAQTLRCTDPARASGVVKLIFSTTFTVAATTFLLSCGIFTYREARHQQALLSKIK